jgi:hypothetical protein
VHGPRQLPKIKKYAKLHELQKRVIVQFPDIEQKLFRKLNKLEQIAICLTGK